MMDEDWDVLASLLPERWRELAATTKATKGLRQDKSEASLLRTLLIHFACGYSLRETAVRAREANLAELSDVALLKRIRKSEQWLYALCLELLRQRGVDVRTKDGREFRLFDATTVKEPGKTGSLWRIHYSVRLPSLQCDHFRVTETEGTGTGESFCQYPIAPGDLIMADRGYCTIGGVAHVSSQGAWLTVRLAPTNVRILHRGRQTPFPLLKHLAAIKRAGQICSWCVDLSGQAETVVPGRICAVRKSQEAIRQAHSKLRRHASKTGSQLQPETLKYAEYVMLFTTFPEEQFPACQVLHDYRLRWQIELVFKRFKQIAQLGHLPKYDDKSAKAWLYGKLFVALLTEKLMAYASVVSPWGYDLGQVQAAESVA
jgi:hypothetical protein